MKLHLGTFRPLYHTENVHAAATQKVRDEKNRAIKGNGSGQDQYNATPRISVIILNYNGETILANCLLSVLKTNYGALEVIVVDNGSHDGSLDTVSKFQTIDKRVKLVRNSGNLGFALGNNIGASHAMGDYLLFLNNDTLVEPNWLQELVNVVNRSNSIVAAQPKLLMMDEPTILDSTGGYLTQYGTMYNPGMLNRDQASLTRQSEVLVAKGAALFVKRDIFFMVGKFDSRFFMYNEELDLCWRIWLSGHSVVFVPGSVVYHSLGWTSRGLASRNSFMFYYGHRNYINTLFKNLSLHHFLRFAVPYSVLFLGYTTYSSFRVRHAWYYVTRAWSWNIVNFRSTYAKRLLTQRIIRKVKDDVFLRHLTRKIRLIELLQNYTYAGPQKLSRVLKPR